MQTNLAILYKSTICDVITGLILAISDLTKTTAHLDRRSLCSSSISISISVSISIPSPSGPCSGHWRGVSCCELIVFDADCGHSLAVRLSSSPDLQLEAPDRSLGFQLPWLINILPVHELGATSKANPLAVWHLVSRLAIPVVPALDLDACLLGCSFAYFVCLLSKCLRRVTELRRCLPLALPSSVQSPTPAWSVLRALAQKSKFKAIFELGKINKKIASCDGTCVLFPTRRSGLSHNEIIAR